VFGFTVQLEPSLRDSCPDSEDAD